MKSLGYERVNCLCSHRGMCVHVSMCMFSFVHQKLYTVLLNHRPPHSGACSPEAFNQKSLSVPEVTEPLQQKLLQLTKELLKNCEIITSIKKTMLISLHNFFFHWWNLHAIGYVAKVGICVMQNRVEVVYSIRAMY